jgi:hypothetical protein
MKWWKKDCADADSLEMKELIRQWGWEGYGRLEAIRGMIGQRVTDKCQTFALQMDDGRPYPVELLSHDLGMTVPRLFNFCGFLSAKGLIEREAWESQKLISMPGLKKMADEYTSRVRTKSRHSPDQEQNRQEQITTEQNRLDNNRQEQKEFVEGLRRQVNRQLGDGGEEVLNLGDEDFRVWFSGVREIISEENCGRPNNPFTWVPTTGSFESDLRKLLTQLKDDEKMRILREAYNLLDGQMNWPKYVRLVILYTVRTSGRITVREPFKYALGMIRKPSAIASESADGILSG